MQLENFIHMRDFNFVFAYIPKVACTNWKILFRYLNGETNYLDNQLAHDRQRSGLTHLKDLAKDDYMRLLSDKSTSRYSFVRNPYSRALSAYTNKLSGYAEGTSALCHRNYFCAIFREIDEWRRVERPDKPEVTFSVFLDWIEHSRSATAKNEHWRPQYEIISPDVVEFDFIGRFENLSSDADKLLKIIGCDIKFPSQEDIIFPSSGARERLELSYDDEAMAAVERLYALDFSSFGYRVGALPF